MKKIPKETIIEIEKVHGKATKAEIEQAEILINSPHLLASYYEVNE
jgi:hypothetical protein